MEENVGLVRKFQRNDINKAFVDSVDTIYEIVIGVFREVYLKLPAETVEKSMRLW